MDSPGTVAEEWALLLSWLCQPFNMSDPSIVASQALGAVTQEYLDRQPPEDVQRLHPAHRLSLYAWVVGRPVGDVHIQLPAALPTDLLEGGVRAAYDGLIEHFAQSPTGNWSEMRITSVLWRVAGIAEGLEEGQGPREAIKHRAVAVRGSLPDQVFKTITGDEWLRNFLDSRNSLTHVLPEAFNRAVGLHGSSDTLVPYVQAATYLTATTIGERIRGVAPRVVDSWIKRVDTDFDWFDS